MNRQQLAEEYAFKQMWYSLSFRERLMIKFGWLRVDPRTPPEYYRMGCKELKKAINDVKKPWWDKIATIIGI